MWWLFCALLAFFIYVLAGMMSRKEGAAHQNDLGHSHTNCRPLCDVLKPGASVSYITEIGELRTIDVTSETDVSKLLDKLQAVRPGGYVVDTDN